MTETTSIPALERYRQTYLAPPVAGPGVMTFISQAIAGYTLGGFLSTLVNVFLVLPPYNFEFVFIPPFLLVFGITVGTPIGFVLWGWTRLEGEPLSRTYRATISLLLLAIGYVALTLIAERSENVNIDPLLMLMTCSPGITIGLLTGSRLRPGRELIRGGEAIELLPRILAGVSGVVLRLMVVLLFMASLIAILSTLLSYILNEPIYERLNPAWPTAAFVQFTLSMIISFGRMRFALLSFLTLIANIPLMVCLWIVPDIPAPLQYVGIGFLLMWGVFLLARWRRTDIAAAALKEEFRYYLID